MSDLDAIILAGGKSERLRGIVAPYHKPFLVVDGRSLIVAAVEQALEAGAHRVVVVATAENAMPVSQLVGHHPQVRIILGTGGPARAVRLGLEVCEHERVLVLMSDNVHGQHDVLRVTYQVFAVGVRQLPRLQAVRFTRLVNGEWYEGPPGEDISMLPENITVWCGPLVIARRWGLHVLADQEKIGPLLGQLAPRFELVPVSTVDVGTPEAIRQLTLGGKTSEGDTPPGPTPA